MLLTDTLTRFFITSRGRRTGLLRDFPASLSPDQYRTERRKRGTQESVAAQLGIHAQTIAKRERGAPGAPITREAWLALQSLPIATSARKSAR